MTFMNIYNGLGGVNEQRFYVLTDTPNYYDIDFLEMGNYEKLLFMFL